MRRKAIYEELHPETKHGGNAGGPSGKFCHTDGDAFTKATADATGRAFKGNRHTGSLVSENSAFTTATADTIGKARQGSASDNLSFASATADANGKDKRSVERAAARGEALGNVLHDVVGTSLDKGVELDALAKKTRIDGGNQSGPDYPAAGRNGAGLRTSRGSIG